MSEERDRRIDAWLDGEFDELERDALNQWLLESPENAARFAERSYVHSRLHAWARAHGGDFAGDESEDKDIRDRFGWKPFAAAAALVLGGVVLWTQWAEPSKMKPGETVASLSRSVVAQLELFGASSSFEKGSAVRTGSYQLDEGLVQITFESGVEVVIEAPASFEIHRADLMRISEGRLAATVPPEGVGFTVETPDAEVVDFGTEFAIEVVRDSGSEVHVFKGEVEVQPKQEDLLVDPVRLVTNQATRIDHSTLIPLGISVDDQRFLRSLEEPEPSYSRAVRDLQPLAYYRMGVIDDGRTLADAALGREHVASIKKRNPRRQPFSPGRIGSSLRLDGPRAKSYAQIPSSLELPTDEFTVMAWIYTRPFPRTAVLLSDMDFSGEERFRFGLFGDHGHLGLSLANGKGLLQIADSSPLPLEVWTHVAVVKTHEELRLYRDGSLVSTEILDGFQAQAHRPLSIGGIPKEFDAEKRTQRSSFWHGRIDELAFFPSALSDDHIESLFRITPTNGT